MFKRWISRQCKYRICDSKSLTLIFMGVMTPLKCFKCYLKPKIPSTLKLNGSQSKEAYLDRGDMILSLSYSVFALKQWPNHETVKISVLMSFCRLSSACLSKKRQHAVGVPNQKKQQQVNNLSEPPVRKISQLTCWMSWKSLREKTPRIKSHLTFSCK